MKQIKIMIIISLCWLSIGKTEESSPSCPEVLSACDKALESERNAHEVCKKSDIHNKKQIKTQEKEIKRLSKKADHSHIPHITITSAFWLLVFLL